MPRRHIAQSKYARLVAILRALPQAQHTVMLRLAEISDLLDAPLPPSAHTRQFWSISDAAYGHWRKAGWRASRSHDGLSITFSRSEATPPPDHEAIAAAYRAGATAPQLSRRHDISIQTVYNILRRAGVPRRPIGERSPNHDYAAPAAP